MTRRVSIFGATGSIGQSTLSLLSLNPNAYEVVALTGGKNIGALAKAARDFNVKIAVTAEPQLYDDLKAALAGTDTQVAAGPHALIEAAAHQADWFMSAIVGYAGLAPGLAALQHGTTLALANKESLVTAGPLLLNTARKHGATVLPVDSEHSAVFQALTGEDIRTLDRIIITASGGALRDWPLEKLASATPEQASSHPNWDMGQRITIDSASMFNKAMELIETREFFDVSPEQIEAIIHPESLIHAMVGFKDKGIMAHVGPHDMRHAIGYALNYPNRAELPLDRLDLAKIGQFTFEEACPTRYPALGIARHVMEKRGLAGAVFNGAKEAALDGFLDRKVGFTDMARIVEQVIELMSGEGLGNAEITLDSVHEADQMARKLAFERMTS